MAWKTARGETEASEDADRAHAINAQFLRIYLNHSTIYSKKQTFFAILKRIGKEKESAKSVIMLSLFPIRGDSEGFPNEKFGFLHKK